MSRTCAGTALKERRDVRLGGSSLTMPCSLCDTGTAEGAEPRADASPVKPWRGLGFLAGEKGKRRLVK